MDFGALPPEVNSARMYAGGGSSSLMVAASAWNLLAAELNSAAIGYETIVTRLTGDEWLGPASAAMVEAAAPYLAWMNTTAEQAERAATQARAAAAAYEAALVATVPPAEVATNRAQLDALLSTNVLGQNIPAIAATEAHYSEMWAQDAAVMYDYAGQSSAAAQVTPFTEVQPATTATGLSSQAGAVAQAGADSSASQLISSVQNALGGLASPAAAGTSASSLDDVLSDVYGLFGMKYTVGAPLANMLAPWTTFVSPVQSSIALAHFSTGAINNATALSKAMAPAAAKAASDGAQAAAAGLAGAAGPGGAAQLAAGLGNAASAGRLSVPPAWLASSPALSRAIEIPFNGMTAATADAAGAGNLLGGMPLAAAGAGGHSAGPKYGFRPTIMARPFSAG